MAYKYEVTSRIYLTSDKQTVVSEGDLRARFLLASLGPVTNARADEIRAKRGGKKYLQEIGTGRSKSRKPQADKSAKPEGDKSAKPEGDELASPHALGPDDPMPTGIHTGVPVRDLSDQYLQNLARVSPNYRPMAEKELVRREPEQPEGKTEQPEGDASDII